MTARNVIFVAGIHGIGKTHFCSEVCRLLSIEYLNAGDLIRRFKQEEETTRKYVDNVQRNQESLISALDSRLKEDVFYLLDGHFCLLKEGGRVEKIPEAVFKQINPSAVVLLKGNVAAIKERLERRDKSTYDPGLLDELQQLEIEHATDICRTCGYSLLVRNPHVEHERSEILDFIKGRIQT